MLEDSDRLPAGEGPQLNAVVNKDVPDNAVASGVPAKIKSVK